ncbi:hypothetical protein BU15DRAFT_70275 [Melanogaster broomeanus]|nr:hypothetical protein BU15DRAFT_70275 [Melanogaster broomeanus]
MATVTERYLKDPGSSSNPSSSASARAAPIAAGYNVGPPVDLRDPPSDQVVVDYPPIFANPCRFRPFEEDLNPLTETPRWQKDLDHHFTIIFKESVLSDYSIDEMATRTLQIVGNPTALKIRGLAQAVLIHWTRMQFDSGDMNVSATELVALVSRISRHLGCVSVHAKQDFLDELTLVEVSTGEQLPLSRENILTRVVAIITIIGHLFRGSQLPYGGALAGLEYFAGFTPLPQAVATIYALLLRLGPEFAIQAKGCHFIRCLLAKLSQFTVGRLPVDPLCQLVFAINALVEEWQRSTRTTLYHTSVNLPHAP